MIRISKVAITLVAICVSNSLVAQLPIKATSPLRVPNQGLLNGIKEGNLAKVEQALQAGASVEYKDPQNNNRRPLHLAVLSIKPAIVNALIKHGADVNALDAYDGTPLFWAVFMAATRPQAIADIKAIIQRLLQAPNIATSFNIKEKSSMQTPLEFAKAHNLTDIVALLSTKK